MSTQKPQEDADLKRLARRDRNAALNAVVHRHRPRLLRHAAHIVRDEDAAADIVQEAFIRAMREPRLFEDDFRIGAWLYRVTNNLALNASRDHRRRGDILTGMQLSGHIDADQHQALDDKHQANRVQVALECLSANHRRVLQERFYHDLSYGEIAAVLDVKMGTVMSRIARAKNALVELIDTTTWLELG
ncbi:MAG TPA: RNA polymerase sigma factor [Myxococcota bacterium]|nr:RNA polymerase sigma factor [Myxococcota bacterium]